MRPKFKVIDGLKGLSTIFLVLDTPEVLIYYIDCNSILKGVEPAWFIADGGGKNERHRLIWIDPRSSNRKNKTIKTSELDFGGSINDYAATTSTSKYSCTLTLYKKGLLEKAVNKKPFWRSKENDW